MSHSAGIFASTATSRSGSAEMAERRRYTRKQKLAAVMAAEMGGVVMAEEQTGVPESTIRYWLEKPEFAQFRAKTREDLAEEVKVAAHLAWKRVIDTAPTMEPRDAIFAAEKAATILSLLTGEATSRVETRELLQTFDDHEIDAVESWLHDLARERMASDAGD